MIKRDKTQGCDIIPICSHAVRKAFSGIMMLSAVAQMKTDTFWKVFFPEKKKKNSHTNDFKVPYSQCFVVY